MERRREGEDELRTLHLRPSTRTECQRREADDSGTRTKELWAAQEVPRHTKKRHPEHWTCNRANSLDRITAVKDCKADH